MRKLSPNTRVLRGSYTQKRSFHYFNYLNGVKSALFQFKDSGLNQLVNGVGVELITLAVQVFQYIGFLLRAATRAIVNHFCGFDRNFRPRLDFLELLSVHFLFQIRDKESGNDCYEQSDNSGNNIGNVNYCDTSSVIFRKMCVVGCDFVLSHQFYSVLNLCF